MCCLGHGLEMWEWSYSGVRELLYSLSSSGTRANDGIRRRKKAVKHSSEWARYQKAVGGIYLT
jgi:hypothetical protein